MVEFDLLGEIVTFKPGQYMTVHLINPPFIDAKGPNRHFSIVNSPTINSSLTMATRIRDSAFKKSLQASPIGTEIDIMGINGSFVLPEDITRPLVFIAGGIGITPFMSMLRFIKDQQLPYKITLLYSNRDQKSAPFLEELQELFRENANFKLILTMTEDPNWPREKNKIEADFLKKYLDKPNEYTYYMAGPPPMVEAVYSELTKAGIEEKNIITENFTGY